MRATNNRSFCVDNEKKVYAQIKQMVSIIGVFVIYPKTWISEPLHWKLLKFSTNMKILHEHDSFV